MALSAAEKNRRKRERKKKEKEERRQRELKEKEAKETLLKKEETEKEENEDVEIEYVAEDLSKILGATKPVDTPPQTTSLPDGLPPVPGSEQEKASSADSDNNIEEMLRRFHERAAVAPSASDEKDEDGDKDASKNKEDQSSVVSDDYSSDDDDDKPTMSKRKLRELLRPSVAELKRRVDRPDLVEAHDVTAADPDFLIALKGISHTTPVPFHWGRKRKYLQGKRGIEKKPFQLPDFIVKTGIVDVRDTAMEDEANQSAKQKNRGRVNPKMGPPKLP